MESFLHHIIRKTSLNSVQPISQHVLREIESIPRPRSNLLLHSSPFYPFFSPIHSSFHTSQNLLHLVTLSSASNILPCEYRHTLFCLSKHKSIHHHLPAFALILRIAGFKRSTSPSPPPKRGRTRDFP